MNKEYVPKWRRVDLVRWAIGYFPDSPPTKFKKMKKSQLWAIWFSEVKKYKKKARLQAFIDSLK